MARKIKTTKSPEERRAEAEGLHATIAEQVEELRSSEAWTRFLTFAQAFHRYSINNLLLILAQKPEATHVAGYRTWQSIGRQVRKGERGIRICRDNIEHARRQAGALRQDTQRQGG